MLTDRLLIAVLVSAGLFLLPPSSALAEDAQAGATAAQRAERHSRLGVEYYQSGQYKEAVREMMLAYEAVPDAMLLYNVARIYQKMDQGDLAMSFFKRFVSHEGADPDTVQEALGHMESIGGAAAVGAETAAPVENIEGLSVNPNAVAGQSAPQQRPGRRLPSPAFLPIAVAGASFGSMAVAGLSALVESQNSKDSTRSWEARVEDRVEAENLALVADVSLGVGVAASVTAVVALLVKRHRPRRAGAKAGLLLVPVGPVPGPGLTLSVPLGATRRLR